VPLEVVRMGTDVSDPDGAWAAVSGLGAEGAVLVRPDQHVAWRSTGPGTDPTATLADVLAALVDR
jgi:2,4-dichlorophenol 6-monooxygenase